MEDLEIPELRKELARAFLRHSSAVLGLSEKTDLEIYVLAGLAALKSRRCSTWRPDKSSSLTTVLPGQRCPCCHPIFAGKGAKDRADRSPPKLHDRVGAKFAVCTSISVAADMPVSGHRAGE